MDIASSFESYTVFEKTLQSACRNSSPEDELVTLGVEPAPFVSCTLSYTDPFLYCLATFPSKQTKWMEDTSNVWEQCSEICMHRKNWALRQTLHAYLPVQSHNVSKKSTTSWCLPLSRVFTPQSRYTELTTNVQSFSSSWPSVPFCWFSQFALYWP